MEKRRRRREAVVDGVLLGLTSASAGAVIFILAFVLGKAWPALHANGVGFFTRRGWDQDFYQAWVAGRDSPSWRFGAMPLWVGTVLTTAGALAVAVPFGLACAIFLAELGPRWARGTLESLVRLLAGIPSVIFGLVGLQVVVPAIRRLFVTDELALRYIKEFAMDGTSLLAGIVVLSAMIVPLFIALATDALRAVPEEYREGSMALGATRWTTAIKVMLPIARGGISAGAILAAGRAVGEAIALCMVTGSVGHVPDPRRGLVFFLEPVRSLASTIVDNAEGMSVPTCESALFACGALLLLSSLALSLGARVVVARVAASAGGR